MNHPNEHHRRRLASELFGSGLEIGPGCHPLALGPGARQVRYIDRYDRASFGATFPECLPEISGFPEDVTIADVARADLTSLVGKASLDFVILNHVLEHVVDPIRLLRQVHGTLAIGGILYLAIPDKRFMFDRFRRRTRLAELIERHQSAMVEPTDAMIADFIQEAEQTGKPVDWTLPENAHRIADHRRRSIHANVWVVEDLLELLKHVTRECDAPWELYDGIVTPTEAILLVRRAENQEAWHSADRVMSRIWFDSQTAWLERELLPPLDESRNWTLDLHERVMRLDERARETQNFVRRIKRMLERMPLVRQWVKERPAPAPPR